MNASVISAMASKDVRKAAIAWYVLLCSGDATPADRQQWQGWLDRHPEHRQAWERIESMRLAMQKVPGPIAAPVLRRASVGRRHVVRAGLGLAAGAGFAGLSWQVLSADSGWSDWTADHRTAVGERRVLALDDGSRLVVNTRSAVNLRFDAQRRLVELVAGEIWIQTAARPDRRPFIVRTPQGSVRALGTRFTVRSEAGRSSVTVLRDAVEVCIDDAHSAMLLAGQQRDFTRQQIGAARPDDEGAGAWEQGSIVVNDAPLGDLVRELARYRKGRLACEASVAGLRVSGAFPVGDTDKALAVLALSLPVRIARLTDYWVTVSARA